MILFFKCLQVAPFVRINEVHEIKQFTNIIVEWSLYNWTLVHKTRLQKGTDSGHEDSVSSIDVIEALEE